MMGDRRDHYEAETDFWEMVTRIAQGRKEREIDPAAAALRACLAEAKGDPRVGDVAMKRLAEMGQFLETVNRWYDQMISVPAPKIMALMRMGAKVANFLNFGRKGGRRLSGAKEGAMAEQGKADFQLIPFPAARRTASPPDIGDLRFRTLVGEAAWARLPEAVRTRFGKMISAAAIVSTRARSSNAE